MVKKQDEIDGAVKDNPIEETPESKLETTPKQDEEVVTLSKQELQNRIDAEKAVLGRTLKQTLDANVALQTSYDEQGKRLKGLESDFNTFRQRDREAELEKYKDDKGMYDVVKVRHQAEDEREQVRRERSDFEKDKAQHQTRIEAAMKAEADSLAKELAEDSGLAATLIIQIGTDTTDGRTSYNLERMKQIAKSVPKGKEEEEEEGESTLRGQRTRAPGTGGRLATKGLSTITDYYEAYNRGEISNEEMAKARQRFGVA